MRDYREQDIHEEEDDEGVKIVARVGSEVSSDPHGQPRGSSLRSTYLASAILAVTTFSYRVGHDADEAGILPCVLGVIDETLNILLNRNFLTKDISHSYGVFVPSAERRVRHT
jgi:hypothetical protein